MVPSLTPYDLPSVCQMSLQKFVADSGKNFTSYYFTEQDDLSFLAEPKFQKCFEPKLNPSCRRSVVRVSVQAADGAACEREQR